MRRLLLMALLAAAVSTAVSAQETTGTITGSVTDQTGVELPGVSITLRNTNTYLSRTVVTNENGSYTATLLPIGVYEVTFQRQRFQQVTLRDVAVHVTDRLQLDAKLTLEGVAENIEFTAARGLVQPVAALQSTMTTRQVRELPLNNRNFVQLATLAPGVSSDLSDEAGVGLASTVSISMNGARRNAVNWLVDGVSDIDVGSNITLLATPTLESIEEFKLITNGYQAEWPRSGGGVVNVVTRSGGARYAASIYEFLRADKLNANSFFRNLSTSSDLNSHPPLLRYNNFGATIGGPVLKNKMFFFYSQEWRRITREPAATTAFVFDPLWLNDPTNSNYVAPAQRDPNAIKLLTLFPAPNVAGTNRFINPQANINNTRQEVVRVDYDLNSNWRLTGRYTHDSSFTEEPGGLFLTLLLPTVATTDTNVPGQVAAASLRTIIGSQAMNELTLQFSSNHINDTNPSNTPNTRSGLGINIPEVFSGNAGGLIPFIGFSGSNPSTVGANQLFGIQYRNYTISDNFATQRRRHAMKAGGLATFEAKNENAANETQGRFSFGAGGGRTAVQNFLTGNTDGLCGANCTYSESETDVTEHLRFNRYEFYAQDTWKPRSHVTVEVGVRYSLYPPLTDANNLLTNFSPTAYKASAAPACANAACTLLTVGTGDSLNGIVVAGKNSPFGDAIYAFDKGDVQPRAGITWDPGRDGRTMIRSAYGLYYDQALVGIFEQNAFTNLPNVNTISLQNVRLSNPGAGATATTTGVRTLIGSSDDFNTPRTQQWNVGMQRQLYSRGVIDISYVGAHGDHLIRPIDINYPQPADVVRLGSVNLARPYLGYGTITIRQTTARSNYWGLLSSFRHDTGAAGSLTVNYTLSRNRTDSTSDRDTVDIPQNPLDIAAEYADARTDRRHILTANYVFELPFFKESANKALKAVFAGWQIAGITTVNSGQPIPRISEDTNGFRRGNRPDRVGDPAAGQQTANLYWFNPNAYAPAADGTFGNSARSEFRQPGRNQTDLAISKNWAFKRTQRFQFRADMINAFNHTQWQADPAANGLDNTCTVSLTTCNPSNDTFGQILNTRAPREIQLGFKFYW